MKFAFLTLFMLHVILVPFMLVYNLHRSYRQILLLGDGGTQINQTPYIT